MKKRTRVLKMMSILMSVLLILNSLSFYAVAQDTTTIEPEEEITTAGGLELKADNDNIYKKIHFYLGDSEEATIDDANELATATSKLQQRSANLKEVQVTVQFESDFMNTDKYKAFAKERESLDSIEEVRNFRQRLNSYSKEYHTALVTKGSALLSKMEYNSIEPIGYSPFVVMKMDTARVTANSLVYMAESKNVVSICVDREEQPISDESWDTVLDAINAYDIVSNETYSGWTIRVGVYESDGICDITHENLADKMITLRDSSVIVDDHATEVMSVLTTIAPNAEYFMSEVYQVGIQWFLDNYCDIVNCSFGYYNNTENADGTYTDGLKQYRNSRDGVFDYQVATHFVTVLNSAGNFCDIETRSDYNPENKVTSPGYAYNVITVGGVDVTFEYYPSGCDMEHHSGASYLTDPERAKPNISAPFEVNIPGIGNKSGTSFATPQVAGCLVLLLEHDWSYVTYPERMMSVLMSTAQKTTDYDEDIGKFDEKVGAGVVDLQRMIDSDLSYQVYNETGTSGSEVARIEVPLTTGQELQVSVAWLVTAVNTSSTNIDISNVLVTNYDLRIYNSSGLIRKISQLSHSNVELLRFNATGNDTFSIVVYQSSAIAVGNEGDFISLTYNVVNSN